MKPSGPGLLFAGRFLITVAISVLVIRSVNIFYFFLVQFWKVILFYEFVHFFQVVHFIGIEVLVVVSYDLIRIFSNESALHIRWPKYWEFRLQH